MLLDEASTLQNSVEKIHSQVSLNDSILPQIKVTASEANKLYTDIARRGNLTMQHSIEI